MGILKASQSWVRKPDYPVKLTHDKNPGKIRLYCLPDGRGRLYEHVSETLRSVTNISDISTVIDPKLGKSAKFSGASQNYYSLPELTISASTKWEITFRTKQDGTTNKGILCGDVNSTNSFIFLYDSNYFWHRGSDANDSNFTNISDFTTRATYTLTCDGGGGNTTTMDLYKDGVFIQTITDASDAIIINALGDGYTSSAFSFDGDISFFRVTTGHHYNAREVKSLHDDLLQDLEPDDTYLPFTVATGGATISIDSGSFSLSGSAIDTLYDRLTSVESGAFALTGSSIDTLFNRVSQIDSGTFNLTGSNIDTSAILITNIETGAFVLTGANIGTLYNSIESLESGAFVINGSIINTAGGEPPDILGAGLSIISSMGVYGKSLIDALGADGLSAISISLAGSSIISGEGEYGSSPIDNDGADGKSEIKNGF